ncbi:acyltransferase [Lentzea tibetensis]|nr:acyltransferase [Lentzea tibetensis]
MVLGCSLHHVVGDMHSFMLLMRSWSAFVDGTAPPEVTIVEDRDAYLDRMLPPLDSGQPSYRMLDADDAAAMFAELQRAMQTTEVVQLHFGETEVSRMREKFSAAQGRSLTVNDVLCAHLVDTLHQIEGGTDTRFLNLVVNIRPRLGIPPSVIGNTIAIVEVPGGPGARPELLAGTVRDTVENLSRSPLNLRADRAYLEACDESQLHRVMFRGLDPAHRPLLVSNWCSFDLYDLTFDGRPPVLSCPVPGPTCFEVPWVGVLTKAFGNSGYLWTLGVPAQFADRLRACSASVQAR